MRYSIAIEPGDETTAFGVVVPDFPGCFSGGDTLDEAIENSKEAISLWIETVLDDNGTVPAPGKLIDHTKNPEFSGWTWAVVEIDGALLDDKSERVNISMPKRILARIDRYASAHGETRSGFLVNAALERIVHG
ncbi:MAG: type II toxin-antitoxin system HicB family antitoxin [Desulfobulbus sp.]|uniref:type II toxin-antitoxin system HicB family antitoxin n=1 Tax=Desulfobulbus sp. TaxID=895 RepID=UPI0028460067|nr:type II toxin-antitoxin system HicB family antitoxin [Desulfobulbus sp.]MDR2550006.1 type II toxin-antitoxin system HicB family antitoxin [Desulfobulbus sp.]